MPSLNTVVVYALAAGAVVDLWRHGSIFAPARARLEAGLRPGPLREVLLECDLCLTFQAALWLVALFAFPAAILPAPWSRLLEVAPCFLAAGRVSQLLDGLLPERLRHGRIPKL